MSDIPSRWLDAETAANYLTIKESAFLRRVKDGNLPAPSYHMGHRTPRWDREALDARLANSAALPKARPFSKAVNDILSEGRKRAHRPQDAGRRFG